MEYFKINQGDCSRVVNSLKINSAANYVTQTTASGNTVVDYINTKRTIEVGIIPLDSITMSAIQSLVSNFTVSISFRNPETEELEENVQCIIPANNIEYYTIQTDKVKYKAFTLKFIEL